MNSAVAITPREEYDTQFFGFSPIAFVDSLFNAFYDYMHNMKSTLQEYLCQEYGGKVMERGKIQSSTEELFASLDDPMETNFDKLEMYLLNNTLCVPSHVLLPEDAVHGRSPHVGCDLDEEAETIKNKIIMETEKRDNLKCDIEFQKCYYKRLSSLMDTYCAMEEIDRDTGTGNFKEDVEHGFEMTNELLACIREATCELKKEL